MSPVHFCPGISHVLVNDHPGDANAMWEILFKETIHLGVVFSSVSLHSEYRPMQIPMAVTAVGNIPSEDNEKTPQSCNRPAPQGGAPWQPWPWYGDSGTFGEWSNTTDPVSSGDAVYVKAGCLVSGQVKVQCHSKLKPLLTRILLIIPKTAW